MKILKMYAVRSYGHTSYRCVVDEIPTLTYEQVPDGSYVGSAFDKQGNVLLSDYLFYRPGTQNAFAGRELTLTMKDGTISKIKDSWWDKGAYPEHGKFVSVGLGTIDKLRNCYGYAGYNIEIQAFEKMLVDYYQREKEYSYNEIREWVQTQAKMYLLYHNGKLLPYKVNKYGQFFDVYTNKREDSCTRHKVKNIGDKKFHIFTFKYKDENGRNHELNMKTVIKESIPRKMRKQVLASVCRIPEFSLINIVYSNI